MKLSSKNLFQFGGQVVSNELFGMGSKLPSLKGGKEDIPIIKETLLNDEWLNKHKLSKGDVNFGNGTFILPNYGDSFKAMLGAYQKCIFTNVATLEKFEKQLPPFAQFLRKDPKGKNPQLVATAKKLQIGKLLPTPTPPTKTIPKPDANGVKALAQTYIAALGDRTNFVGVPTTIETITDDWYADSSEFRKNTGHDSDGDLIVRAVSGALENGTSDSELYLEYQDNEGFNRVKGFLLKDIIKLLKATL